MRNILRTVFVTAMLTASFASYASCAEADAYTTADILNVRTMPNTDSAVIGQCVYGSSVEIIGRENEWYKIKYGNGCAYVHGDYVQTNAAPAAVQAQAPLMGQQVVNIAKQYIGTPYVYGGMSPAGFDCSGFVKYVYSQLGVNLNRVAEDQAKNGYAVTRDSLAPGDIICFSSGSGSSYISHVGIYVGDGKFIHSPRTGYTVTIENLNSGSYSRRYYCARRIF